jgi:hypothetical protein
LTLIEKRIFITSSKKFGTNIIQGQRDLFDDLILNIRVSDLCSKMEDNKKKPKAWRNFAPASPMQMKMKTIG